MASKTVKPLFHWNDRCRSEWGILKPGVEGVVGVPEPSIEPIKRTRAYEQIVRQLADLIEHGDFQPGDRLPSERDMARDFGVGRPTLRQALSVLSAAGVLEILPGSGIYLRKQFGSARGTTGNAMAMLLMTEKQDLNHILELRIAVEGNAAYLAAQRRTPVQLSELEEAYENLSQALMTRGEAITEDFRFHSKIAEATGNPVFLKVMVSLADLFLQQFEHTTRHLYHEPDRVEANQREHRAIVDAILEQRPEAARQAMVSHLARVGERLERAEQILAGRED